MHGAGLWQTGATQPHRAFKRMHAPSTADGAEWLVACLCARWCTTCEAYRLTFAQVGAQFPALRFVWVDIEDEADALGAIDVDNFPSLLIADGDAVRFFGPVTPQPQTALRLIHRALLGELGGEIDASAEGLPARIRALIAGDDPDPQAS